MANKIIRRLTEKKDHFKYSFAHILELPKEVLLDLPSLTLIGTMQVHLETHKGIVEFTAERVRINTQEGILEINGKGLFLRIITHQEIVIDGEISALSYHK
ncbi:sporulation protein YqfC [Metallumcola ferriviriculae]|uniref:Sporulation protein YqfC n=1 Tax=Metallumcola ferriviriculae TaxID=3039180 RepID=A0AAU0UM47_9FIRM|nr:sporulation protein YqfC [Desulfitibacteraceae bacterium MK1]